MSATSPDANSVYYAATRVEMCDFLPTTYSRVLEVGCGRGGFRSNLNDAAEVWGVEPFGKAAECAKARMDHVLVGKFEDVRDHLPNAAFDLVICNDVIEHMEDDIAFLKSVRQKMQTGGYIMGSVPNMRYLPVLKALVFNKEWEYQDEGVLDRTHLRFYTVKSFPPLLARAGFEIVRFAGINKQFYRANWLMSQVLKTPWMDDVLWLQFAFLARIPP